jgi:hypothetical protein
LANFEIIDAEENLIASIEGGTVTTVNEKTQIKSPKPPMFMNCKFQVNNLYIKQ